jgi:hypothetical protein
MKAIEAHITPYGIYYAIRTHPFHGIYIKEKAKIGQEV